MNKKARSDAGFFVAYFDPSGENTKHNRNLRSMRKVEISDPSRLAQAMKQQSADEVIHVFEGDLEVAVVLSRERYLELLMKDVKGDVNPLVVELLHESVKKNDTLYRALAKFD